MGPFLVTPPPPIHTPIWVFWCFVLIFATNKISGKFQNKEKPQTSEKTQITMTHVPVAATAVFRWIYLSSHTATPPREDYMQVIARREEKKKERMNSENKSATVRWI